MFGDRVAKVRKNKRWSQADLAKRIGVSPSTIGMYEQGRREPCLSLLIALSRELNVSVQYLLTGEQITNLY